MLLNFVIAKLSEPCYNYSYIPIDLFDCYYECGAVWSLSIFHSFEAGIPDAISSFK